MIKNEDQYFMYIVSFYLHKKLCWGLNEYLNDYLRGIYKTRRQDTEVLAYTLMRLGKIERR